MCMQMPFVIDHEEPHFYQWIEPHVELNSYGVRSVFIVDLTTNVELLRSSVGTAGTMGT